VLKCLSVRSIVSAAARTGTESRRRIDVIKIDQTKREVCHQFIFFIFIIVVIKFIAPNRDENPAI
jgi:hypothetical protein